MKSIIHLLLIQFLITNFSSAQDIYIEIKNEFNISEVKFNWNTNLKNESVVDELNYNYSIGLSGRLYKNLFLKTTVGSNDFKNSIQIEWNSENAEHQILGWISANQNYLEILPEVRLLKNNLIFINMGIGFNQIRTSKFLNGYYRRNSDFFYQENEFPTLDGKYQYFSFSVGTNLQYQNIGLIAEFGIKRSGFTKIKTEIPGIGVNQQSIKLGISYKIN